jgi:uncharacterized protein (TIGR00369 family)
MRTKEELSTAGERCLPGHLGLVVEEVSHGKARISMPIREIHMAPNGYLHAGAVITLADTSAGYGCMASRPEGATGFTTVELKSNHVGTALDGTLECTATAAHMGRTTQVWDAVVTHLETGRTIALFRCTQLLIYPRPEQGAAKK